MKEAVAKDLPLRDDAILMSLGRYWSERRQGRDMPDRADVDALTMPRRVLANVGLAELSDGGRRIKYRLVGTEIVNRLGVDFTGRYVSEVMNGSYRLYITSMFRAVFEHRAPLYSEGTFRQDRRNMSRTRRLLLPLTRGGDKVEMVLLGQTWPPSDHTEQQPLLCLLDGGTFEETLRHLITFP